MNKYVEQVREIAISNKYTKYYCNIIEKSLLRTQDRKYLKSIYGYVESHHILPQCFNLGGQKDKENLVFLTAKEHFIVHLCATKMFVSNFKNKMIFAFRQLRSSNKYQNRYMNSRLYVQIKPNFKAFVRLYKKEEVKYIYEYDIQIIEQLIREGWSKEMTDDFKVGRVGNMIGMKHSEESKIKMSLAQKGIPKLASRGRKRSKESLQKWKDNYNANKKRNPEKYQILYDATGERTKALHEQGFFKDKNGMKGKHHTESAKKAIGEIHKKVWADAKNDPILYKKKIDDLSAAQKKKWKDDEFRSRSHVFNSKAYQKYGMSPQEFYDKNLKPLLYLGFLPTSIVRYNLLDMSVNYIKKLIYKFGNENDKKQFEINKFNAAGANKAYRKYLEQQYNKYFKEKLENLNIGKNGN